MCVCECNDCSPACLSAFFFGRTISLFSTLKIRLRCQSRKKLFYSFRIILYPLETSHLPTIIRNTGQNWRCVFFLFQVIKCRFLRTKTLFSGLNWSAFSITCRVSVFIIFLRITMPYNNMQIGILFKIISFSILSYFVSFRARTFSFFVVLFLKMCFWVTAFHFFRAAKRISIPYRLHIVWNDNITTSCERSHYATYDNFHLLNSFETDPTHLIEFFDWIRRMGRRRCV